MVRFSRKLHHTPTPKLHKKEIVFQKSLTYTSTGVIIVMENDFREGKSPVENHFRKELKWHQSKMWRVEPE